MMLILLGASAAHAQVTVTGHIKNPDGSVPKNAKACFSLVGFTPQVPKVVGTGVIVNQKTFCVSADPSTGVFTTPLFPNFSISPSQTFWRVDYIVNGIQQSSATYNVTTNPFNLDSATPVVTFPPPSGFVQGAKTFEFAQPSPAVTWAIPHGFGDKNVVFNCYDVSNKYLIPDTVVETDVNTLTITFTSAQAGTCVVLTGGNVASTSAPANAVVTNPNATQVVNGAPLTVQTPFNATGGGSLLGTFTGPTAISAVNGTQYASAMRCDGATDDTSALSAALAGVLPGTRLTLPQGVCMVHSNIAIPDGVWLQGSGKETTILRQASGTNDSVHCIITTSGVLGNIAISDLTIDGNKGSQSDGLANICTSVTGGMSEPVIQRTRIKNAFRCGIQLYAAAGHLVQDFDISDNDFESNSTATTQLQDEANGWGDICINFPSRGRIHHNKSLNGQGNFICFGGQVATVPIGNVVIDHNIVDGTLGFGVGLGGVGSGTAGFAVIDGNSFNMPGSRENIIDLALWSNTVTSNNLIVAGSCASECGGIGDGPPANNATVTGNIIYGNPALGTNVCIALGGQADVVTNNFCAGAGGAGVVIATPISGTVTVDGLIEGNIIKNNNQHQDAPPGHPGLDFFLNTGAVVTGWTIKGNHIYDDQFAKTQNYGIGLATYGQKTGIANMTFEGNDLRGNLTGGMFLNQDPGDIGITVRGNPGFDPLTEAVVDIPFTANVGSTLLYLVPQGMKGPYLITVSEIVNTPAGTSSTLPSVSIGWQDADTLTTQSAVLTPSAPTGNSLTTLAQGTFVINPTAGTNVAYSTSGYASSPAAAMQYILHLRMQAVQ